MLPARMEAGQVLLQSLLSQLTRGRVRSTVLASELAVRQSSRRA